MQANNNQINFCLSSIQNPAEIVLNVLLPFKMQTNQMKINVYLATNIKNATKITQDWSVYELILFNILQNAIKFNQKSGDVVVVLRIWDNKNDPNSKILETFVIDSGIGICDK
jgi:signal transduction histidine kinase